MVVAQDWASAEFLERPIDPLVVQLGQDPRLPTNKNLKRLLRKHLDLDFNDTYATDAFPFIKSGPIGARINWAAFVVATKEFLVPQIEIVNPRLVICIGKMPFDGLRVSSGLMRTRRLSDAIGDDSLSVGGSRIRCVAHTGDRGTRIRGKEQVDRDWAALRATLNL